MKHKILTSVNTPDLILFFSGWASEPQWFSHLESENYTVIILYDYNHISLPDEVSRIMENYQSVNIIAWSYGVWVANMLFQQGIYEVKKAVAVNGTLNPIDDNNGIPPSIFESTLNNINEKSYSKFLLRMCGSKAIYQKLISSGTTRSVSGIEEELFRLKEHFEHNPVIENIYTFAAISESDNIIPTKNQKNFWKNKDTIALNECHFPFYEWNRWDDIINLL